MPRIPTEFVCRNHPQDAAYCDAFDLLTVLSRARKSLGPYGQFLVRCRWLELDKINGKDNRRSCYDDNAGVPHDMAHSSVIGQLFLCIENGRS